MEIIDKDEYDSEDNEEVASAKSLKGPKCSRILDSDDDCLANISKRAIEDETEDQFLNEKMEVHDSSSSEDEVKSNFKKKSLLKKRHISDSESDVDDKEPGNDNCSDKRVDVWEINEQNKINEDHIDEPDFSFKNKFLDSDIYDAEGSSDEGQLKISDHEVEDNFDVSKKKKKEKKDNAKRSVSVIENNGEEKLKQQTKIRKIDHMNKRKCLLR